MTHCDNNGERILVTGGLGFIGSHQVALLLEHDYIVLVVDNFHNCQREVVANISRIVGHKTPTFHELDVRETEVLRALIADFSPTAAIHFAGHKHVAESASMPIDYYDCNVGGLLSLIQAAHDTPLRKIVFSSSGSIYGETQALPIAEYQNPAPTNPYSTTKMVCERILSDLCRADPSWSAVALRYFNPAGAHPSGLLGEWCVGPPSNLLPRLIDAAYDHDLDVDVHGDDFDTPDGTGVRDYVHVMDVAEAHMRALRKMGNPGQPRFQAINVGRGEGVSVLELISAVAAATNVPLRPCIGPRRPGDVSALYGDTTLATKRLGMTEYRSLEDICDDAWRFKLMNPNGYKQELDE